MTTPLYFTIIFSVISKISILVVLSVVIIKFLQKTDSGKIWGKYKRKQFKKNCLLFYLDIKCLIIIDICLYSCCE